ncbi:MAG: anhydro-N-acetylmuramic acid kinase [Verrucomicrobiota bacterium]
MMNVLGIMSGTSIDSVDYALCSISKNKIQLRELWTADFPKPLRQKLHMAARGDLSSWEFCQLHHDLGRFYAKAAKQKSRPQLIGLHGQTVFHNPSPKNPAGFQLGEPAYLAEKFRVPVVNNFRASDLAAGGQGAPLATIFHQFIFAKKGKHICVQNLGGIGNVTSLDWRKTMAPRLLAFDTGPANMLIDFSMRHLSGGKKLFDAGGHWAAQGKADEKILRRWLRHIYFHQPPPKSTGRELFGEPFFGKAIKETSRLSSFDTVATFTEFTARSIALNYDLHLGSAPDKIILTGGGALNPALVKNIREKFSGEVKTSADVGWPAQSIEPAAFAYLAFLRLRKRPGNLPQTTGARRAVLCGQITQP